MLVCLAAQLDINLLSPLRFLNEPTLEMLADMRAQFARMLSDAGLIPTEAAALAANSSNGAADGWDASTAPWNRHADRPAVVSTAQHPQRSCKISSWK